MTKLVAFSHSIYCWAIIDALQEMPGGLIFQHSLNIPIRAHFEHLPTHHISASSLHPSDDPHLFMASYDRKISAN